MPELLISRVGIGKSSYELAYELAGEFVGIDECVAGRNSADDLAMSFDVERRFIASKMEGFIQSGRYIGMMVVLDETRDPLRGIEHA